jgi:hypothetical protein
VGEKNSSIVNKLNSPVALIIGLIGSVLAIFSFLTGTHDIPQLFPTPTRPQIIERIITATPSFTGNSFAAQPTNLPRATPMPLSTVAHRTEVCGVLTPRLRVGGYGRVFRYPNENNRVRSEPGLDGRQIGVILAGDEFYVAQGPRCVDDIIWWFVEYGGLEGWTAEGLGDRYYVEPS